MIDSVRPGGKGTTAAVTAQGNKDDFTYGASLTTNPDDVAIWRSSNIITGLQPETEYYAFIKDKEGNIQNHLPFKPIRLQPNK